MKLRCLDCWVEFESEEYSVCYLCFGDTMVIENEYFDYLIENIEKLNKSNDNEWIFNSFLGEHDDKI